MLRVSGIAPHDNDADRLFVTHSLLIAVARFFAHGLTRKREDWLAALEEGFVSWITDSRPGREWAGGSTGPPRSTTGSAGAATLSVAVHGLCVAPGPEGLRRAAARRRRATRYLPDVRRSSPPAGTERRRGRCPCRTRSLRGGPRGRPPRPPQFAPYSTRPISDADCTSPIPLIARATSPRARLHASPVIFAPTAQPRREVL